MPGVTPHEDCKPAAQSDAIPKECHPRVSEMAAYWRSIHPANGIPGRQHFDPVHIPTLLSNIRLVDVHGSPLRFRARLVGTKLVELHGFDYTGQWLEDAYANFEGSGTHLGLLAAVSSCKPDWRRGQPLLSEGKDFIQIERLNLPFATDGETVDMVLSYIMVLPA